jgi:hypothetical protein
MNRRLTSLALLIAILLVLSVASFAGLTLAAPSASPPSPQSASGESDPTDSAASPSLSSASSAALPAAQVAGDPPSSRPYGAPASPAARPVFDETSPVATAGAPDAPTAVWNKSLRYVGNTLKPRENDVNYSVLGQGGCVHVISGDVYEVWNVPLTLPEGVQVQWLRMYTYDADAGTAMRGWFTKYDLYGNIVQEWPVASADGGYNYADVQIVPAETIDYSAYSYVINWQPMKASMHLQLCGFRVFYYQPYGTFLPLIRK